MVYTSALVGFIYPVVVHWVWDSEGFLSTANTGDSRLLCGMIDFAGSGVVHSVGGIASIIASSVLGPRRGRFNEDGLPNPGFTGHSIALTVLGTFILWLGWYGFNQGSTLTLLGNAQTAGRVGVTTTLSGAAAAVSGLFIKYWLPPSLGGTHVWDLAHMCNSLLGGLVGITAGCATTEAWAALIIGVLASFVYHGASCMMRKLRIDDPLDAFAVHGACGIFGILMVGFFTPKEYTYAENDGELEYGVFYGGSGLLLATQLSGMIIIVLWVGTMASILFLSLKFLGIFRVSPDVETAGLDVSKHGGHAYEPETVTRMEVAMREKASAQA